MFFSESFQGNKNFFENLALSDININIEFCHDSVQQLRRDIWLLFIIMVAGDGCFDKKADGSNVKNTNFNCNRMIN